MGSEARVYGTAKLVKEKDGKGERNYVVLNLGFPDCGNQVSKPKRVEVQVPIGSDAYHILLHNLNHSTAEVPFIGIDGKLELKVRATSMN